MTMVNMNQMSGMLGGFGVPNGGMNLNGMNGMNMGMNFDPSQAMYGWNGQNNSMWQNNNANAFPNAMGNNYGSTYGPNAGPNGNFQQDYPSGDFQNGFYNGRGYGRGRGRGRGGFGRGRGNFNQYSQYQQQQSYQNGPGPRQFEDRNMQSQVMGNDRAAQIQAAEKRQENHESVDENHEDDDFAPGGQEEVQEALGEDYQKSTVAEEAAIPENVDAADPDRTEVLEIVQQDDVPELDKLNEPAVKGEPEIVEQEASKPIPAAPSQKPIPEAYNEDLQGSMAPPSAPLGPSAQYGDYGFRSRGHGRFSSRGRGSISIPNGHVASPVKPFSPAPPPTGPRAGVVGAPTGPRAMREPPSAPARPVSRSANTGFQIMGRASMAASSRSESRDVDRGHSRSPVRESRDLSRRPSRQEKYSNANYEADEQPEVNPQDQDKRSRRASKQGTYDDYNDRDEQGSSYPQSEPADYKSTSRHSRDNKDRSSKHSSRSKRHHEEDTNGDHEMDDYEDSARSSRDAYGESRSKHRSSKSSRYDDRERDRDHDRERVRAREKPREEDRDKDRDREERHRDRDRDRDSHKRSRNDRHREDNEHHDYHYDQRDEEEAIDEPESRHRSRRHKKDHNRDASEHNNGTTIPSLLPNGRSQSNSHRSTPAPASTSTSTPVEEKDPNMLEREKNARARMLREEQRRAKPVGPSGGRGAGTSLGRRVGHKYEDDLERHLVEGERQRHSGRSWK